MLTRLHLPQIAHLSANLGWGMATPMGRSSGAPRGAYTRLPAGTLGMPPVAQSISSVDGAGS
jgi:hypothetical protein